jgi:hypothetical protein
MEADTRVSFPFSGTPQQIGQRCRAVAPPGRVFGLGRRKYRPPLERIHGPTARRRKHCPIAGGLYARPEGEELQWPTLLDRDCFEPQEPSIILEREQY